MRYEKCTNLDRLAQKVLFSTLTRALLDICQIAKKFNRDKLAISVEDKLFEYYSQLTIKEIVDTAIFGYEIILFDPPKWITSEKEKLKIMEEYHAIPTGGHIGEYRLYLKIREKFKWNNMKQDIISYVQKCKICKDSKVNKHTKEKSIITSTPAKPFTIISIDTVGPLSKTINNNRYAITIQCDL